ncbi:MAG: hypothetical protein LBE13_04025 [Bacteroidales bacterium]|nr:hypothetical protein [Bacteroidales bacterium]
MKKVVGLLGLVAFVALCAINFKIGSADYNQKSRASLLTLEALANGEAGGGEASTSCLINKTPVLGYKKSVTTQMHCYGDRTGPDRWYGAMIECAKNKNVNNYCTENKCNSTGCYVSDQKPTKSNN